MTEAERNHLLRMVRHAEKVRRNMNNLRETNEHKERPNLPEQGSKPDVVAGREIKRPGD
jgi:hypothetical protein